MKKLTEFAGAGIATVALSLALVGCGSDTKTVAGSPTADTATTTTTTTTSKEAPTTSAEASGANYTIMDYIKDNDIVETPAERGDPGAPTIDLPFPPGWSDAGADTPEWAYGKIVYDDSTAFDDPANIIAIVSRLTGDVDPDKILEFAPGELQNLPGYDGSDGSMSTLSDFDAIQLGGSYRKDGEDRFIAQKTVVIPGEDGLYVLQLNANSPEDEQQALMEATDAIDEETVITP
jgi:hypothetical protein